MSGRYIFGRLPVVARWELVSFAALCMSGWAVLWGL